MVYDRYVDLYSLQFNDAKKDATSISLDLWISVCEAVVFMKLFNEKYTVITKVEVMPPLDHFDIVYDFERINTGHDVYMVRVLQIAQRNSDVLTIALLDTVCSGYEPHAVLTENIITVILFSAIVRINLDTGLIVQYVECDSMGGLFEIHPIDGGYIIWGEDKIFRYDLELNQIWWFAGRDILVSQIQDRHFWIEDGLIHCRDFEGWHYVLNFDGDLITNFQERAD